MRLRAKIDANQPRIVAMLRSVGCMVQSLAQVGGGVPDLLVGARGRLVLLEVKDGDKPPSQRKLTEAEAEWHKEWSAYPVHVVENELQALLACGFMVDFGQVQHKTQE